MSWLEIIGVIALAGASTYAGLFLLALVLDELESRRIVRKSG
jgi:hypothetical protein